MGNNRSVKKNNKKTVVNDEPVETNNLEELQHLIAKAILEAEEKKEAKSFEKRLQAHKEWQNAIGYKTFTDKSVILRLIKTAFNRVKCLLKMEFIPASKIKGDRASISLLKILSELVLRTLQVLMVFSGLALIVISIVLKVQGMPLGIMQVILYVVIGIALLIMSGIFRMASIEIDSFEDRNYLVGLFAAITSIISIAVAIVAIIYQR